MSDDFFMYVEWTPFFGVERLVLHSVEFTQETNIHEDIQRGGAIREVEFVNMKLRHVLVVLLAILQHHRRTLRVVKLKKVVWERVAADGLVELPPLTKFTAVESDLDFDFIRLSSVQKLKLRGCHLTESFYESCFTISQDGLSVLAFTNNFDERTGARLKCIDVPPSVVKLEVDNTVSMGAGTYKKLGLRSEKFSSLQNQPSGASGAVTALKLTNIIPSTQGWIGLRSLELVRDLPYGEWIAIDNLPSTLRKLKIEKYFILRFTGCEHLTKLTLKHCKLTRWAQGPFTSLQQLKIVDLQFEYGADANFSNAPPMPALTELIIDQTECLQKGFATFLGRLDSLRKARIQGTDLDGMAITTVLPANAPLEELDIRNNFMRVQPAREGRPNDGIQPYHIVSNDEEAVNYFRGVLLFRLGPPPPVTKHKDFYPAPALLVAA
jgi:hypothetical protein